MRGGKWLSLVHKYQHVLPTIADQNQAWWGQQFVKFSYSSLQRTWRDACATAEIVRLIFLAAPFSIVILNLPAILRFDAITSLPELWQARALRRWQFKVNGQRAGVFYALRLISCNRLGRRTLLASLEQLLASMRSWTKNTTTQAEVNLYTRQSLAISATASVGKFLCMDRSVQSDNSQSSFSVLLPLPFVLLLPPSFSQFSE